MSIFEALMLICFGAAWPVSIYKSYKSRKNSGKSFGFMVIIFIGYISGIANKLLNTCNDPVIYLYFLNALMVATDITLYFRNKKIEKQN
jgi:hypothetical protein